MPRGYKRHDKAALGVEWIPPGTSLCRHEQNVIPPGEGKHHSTWWAATRPRARMRDGAGASAAFIFHPAAIVFDRSGNYYISEPVTPHPQGRQECNHHNVSRYSISGYNQDGPDRRYAVNNPQGLAYRRCRYLYIAERTTTASARSPQRCHHNDAGTGSPAFTGDNGLLNQESRTQGCRGDTDGTSTSPTP